MLIINNFFFQIENLNLEDKEIFYKKFCVKRFLEASTGSVLYKKGVLRNFAKFRGKYLCQSLFFNKVAGPSLKFRKIHRKTLVP